MQYRETVYCKCSDDGVYWGDDLNTRQPDDTFMVTKHWKTVLYVLYRIKADVGANALANSDLALVTSSCENVSLLKVLHLAQWKATTMANTPQS
jgi:hypothetical protein